MAQLKFFLSFIFFIGALISRAQVADGNFIYWAENSGLNYRSYQFIMSPDSIENTNGREIGFAATGVRIARTCYARNGFLEYNIKAYVDLNGSYIMPDTFLGKSLNYVLEHEQTHFNISEL